MGLFNKDTRSNATKWNHAWLRTKDTFKRGSDTVQNIGRPNVNVDGGRGFLARTGRAVSNTATTLGTKTVNTANWAVNNRFFGPIILIAAIIAIYKLATNWLKNLFTTNETKKIEKETDVLRTATETEQIRGTTLQLQHEMQSGPIDDKSSKHWQKNTGREDGPRVRDAKIIQMEPSADSTFRRA